MGTTEVTKIVEPEVGTPEWETFLATFAPTERLAFLTAKHEETVAYLERAKELLRLLEEC